MPLVHRTVTPVKVSSAKLNLSKTDSEFFAVNNGSLVNILRQLSSLVTHAGDIFAQISIVAGDVGLRIQSIKLRLDELEAKVELFDPKLVPVPEGTLDDEPISHEIRPAVQLHSQLFLKSSRPPFLIQLYDKTGKRIPQFPLRSPVLLAKSRHNANTLEGSRRPASIAALRDWKLDDYVDEKLTTLERKKKSTPEELNQTVCGSFGPTQVVQVDVTGSGFDRMKSNRRSLTIHTKRIRSKKKRRNTICGAMPNKECGIQTSFSSVLAASDNKKYGIDSGHWSSCTTSGVGGASSTSAPSPWDPNSITTSSDFLYDDEDRSLTPQLENFTDGLVSDSDCSVDSAGFFTSFRNDCGFPKSKKAVKDKEDSTNAPSTPATVTENEYELFGKGSTSTTASSCGTVVLRRKPDGAETSTEQQEKKGDDVGWEERVKRKSLIEIVPSMVVVTPSPSCSLNGGSPPPLKEPEHADIPYADEDDGSSDDRLTPRIMESDSESGTLSDNDDLENRRLLDSATPPAVPPDIPPREPHLLITSDASSSSSCSSNATVSGSGSGSSSNNAKQDEQERSPCGLPKPDVIPDVQQLQVIRTSTTPKLKSGTDYVSLDTVQLECRGQQNGNSSSSNETLDDMDGEAKPSNSNFHQRPGVSARIRGAKVVLDPNGEIIFSSETLKRKRRQKISFDPGASVKPAEYDSKSSYNRARESIYDRLRPEKVDDEIYECIEKIRQHNLKESEAIEKKYDSLAPLNTTVANGSSLDHQVAGNSSHQSSALPSPSISMILETDLDNLPPVMPELETLPKIKDRLKRNESYRMANEELALRPALSIHNRQLNGLNGHKSTLASAGASRKRDIPEEDPVFVQQILSLSSSTNSLSRNSPIPSTNHHSLFGRASSSNSNHNAHISNNSLVLAPSSPSKFALSPDDRPSFLRRESPPSMDSITKEIYRFRKKFNIHPNASSASLLRSPFPQKGQKSNNSSSDLYAQILPKSSRLRLTQNEKKVPPSTPLRSIFNYTGSPLSTSTPIRSTAVTSKSVPVTQGSVLLRQPFFGRKQVYSSFKQSGTQAFDDPKKDKSIKSVTFQFPKLAPGTPGIADSSTGVAGISYSAIKSPGSESATRTTNNNTASHQNRSGTSLNDFKKLLQATRASSVVKKSPISAMEILKPKIGKDQL